MRVLSAHSPEKEICFMKGAQIGATEMGLNFIGYSMKEAPGPMMLVMPTNDNVKQTSNHRLTPMIEMNPVFEDIVATKKSRDKKNTILEKEFLGGFLMMVGANSPTKLRSTPVRYMFMDEIDEYPLDLKGQGSAIELGRARTRNFFNKKIYYASTPTIQGQSAIEQIFNESDKRFYNVPCPGCGHFQIIEWKRIKWTENDFSSAMLFCEACGMGIKEGYKNDMLANGKWIPTAESEIIGFHLSSLYSPLGWYSWAQAAKDFTLANKVKESDPGKLKAFINTVLGDVWFEKADTPDWKLLYDRRESFSLGVVPKGAIVLTMSVDVQRDRLEYLIQGWGPRLESWIVDYQVISGDTSTVDKSSPWEKLSQIIKKKVPTADGGELSIKQVAIDSGYETSTVYTFCGEFSKKLVVPVKGVETQLTAISRGVPLSKSKNVEFQKRYRGLELFKVGTDIVKSELFGWLRKPMVDPAEKEVIPYGYCHFPQLDEEFFRQLCAEQKVSHVVGAIRKFVWKKIRARNEALDLMVYSRACVARLGLESWSDDRWKVEAHKTGRSVVIDQSSKPQVGNKKRRRRIVKKSEVNQG